MQKFKVYLSRFVEQTAVIEIEAENAAAALDKGRDGIDGDGIAWEAGDSVVDEEVYTIKDAADGIVWESGIGFVADWEG